MSILDKLKKAAQSPELFSGEPKGDACLPGMNVTNEPIKMLNWSPKNYGVQLMVAGNPHDSQKMGQEIMKIQQSLSRQIANSSADTKLLMSVMTFLDHKDPCKHQTPWSSDPADMNSTTQRWHCYQTQTQFHEAMNVMGNDCTVNTIIMVGNQFNEKDKLEAIKTQAKALAQKGIRTFTIPLTNQQQVCDAYAEIAEAGEGLYLPEIAQNANVSTDELMNEIIQASLLKDLGQDLLSLPAPAKPELAKVRARLEHKL